MAFIDSVSKGFWAILDIGITQDIRPEETKHIRYLKVIKNLEKERQTHVVHFTSIPPEVDSYFLALRQYVV